MQNCMDKYKNDFTIRFAQLMQDNLAVWKELQRQKRKSLYNIESIGEYLFAALLAFIPGKREREYNLKLHCVMAVIFFIGSIIINIGIKNAIISGKRFSHFSQSIFFNVFDN